MRNPGPPSARRNPGLNRIGSSDYFDTRSYTAPDSPAATEITAAVPAVLAPSIVPPQRPLPKAVRDRLFGPVEFATGLPAAFLRGWP
jgi:hypothetical protein